LPLDRAEMDIDIAADATDLPLILRGIRKAWTHLGEVRPHHSVLTTQEYHPEFIDAESIERFYATGGTGVSTIAAVLRRYGFADLESKVCVEYGCGLGRMTLALAKVFKRVHGYDISANHLTLAERRATEAGIHNVDFHLCSADPVIEELEDCDFFC
jgi:2-polyprenyl-3-methyl-5-hydroxy-6-metoxy-1,4-benzoquinol methylase